MSSAVVTTEDAFRTYRTSECGTLEASKMSSSNGPAQARGSRGTVYTQVGNVLFVEGETSVLFWGCPIGPNAVPDALSIYRLDYEKGALNALAQFGTKTARGPSGRVSEDARFALIWRDIEQVDGLLELYDLTTREFVKIGHDVMPGMAAFGESPSEIFFVNGHGKLKRARWARPNILKIQDVLYGPNRAPSK